MVLAPPAVVARSGVYSCEVFVLVPPLPAIDDELIDAATSGLMTKNLPKGDRPVGGGL